MKPKRTHIALRIDRAQILSKRENTRVVLHSGKYSREDSLVMKGAELHNIAEDMANLLDSYAGLMGFGEEYQQVCDVLKRLNEFHKKSLEMSSTGKDWEACGYPKPERSVGPAKYIGTIFGYDWKKIDEMQQGK
jgi:hypothetical protein